MKHNVLKTEPAVFAVRDTYQIMVPVVTETLMWVKVGDQYYYDDFNGVLRSDVKIHRMIVPMKELDREKAYTICWRRVIERKSPYTETEEIEEAMFSFRPVCGEKMVAYHIADAHNLEDAPVKAAQTFIEKRGNLDFLILNGDLPNLGQELHYFDSIFTIASCITRGEIPIVCTRGNHDMRGACAERLGDYIPLDNGKTYYTFRLGNIWGMVLDCGEDKLDTWDTYGNTICCHNFRQRETSFIEDVIVHAKDEYLKEGVKHRLIICHNPFPYKPKKPFDIEEELYTKWSALLREHIKPQLMICGHLHCLRIDQPGGENDSYGQPCPIVVGATKNQEGYYAGAGFVFDDYGAEVTFTDSEAAILHNEYIQF